MGDVSEPILIAILVIVSLVFLFLIEIYRNMLSILMYYAPEAAPPMELRFSQSFLNAPQSVAGGRSAKSAAKD